MPLETATYIHQLNAANPLGSDPISAGDDHLRLVKSTVKATFPNITGPVTMTQDQLNSIPNLATTAALNSAIAGLSSGGRIVQIVDSVASSGVESFSDTYVATGHTAVITPQATANKILIMMSFGFAQTNAFANNAANAFWTLYRGNTNLGTGSGFGANALGMANVNTINSQSNIYIQESYQLLDSPNTTAQLTYQTYVRRSGNASAGYNTLGNGRIILLEIAQ